MKKARIAYINYHYFDTDVTVIRQLQKAFDIDWFVILRDEDEFDEKYFRNYANGLNVKLHIYKYSCRRRSLKFLYLMLQIVLSVRHIRPNLCYTCTGELYFLLSYYLIIPLIPLVHGVHDVRIHSDVNLTLHTRLSEYVKFKLSGYFFVFSKNQYIFFKQLHPNKICYNVGMSIKNFGEGNTNLYDKTLETKFLMFGSISKYKGFDLLIDSFESIINSGYKTVSLSLYGNCSDTDKLLIKSTIKHANYYNLHLDFVKNDMIRNIYSENHFAVMPYRDATQSGPLMIAINYSLPVIAPRFGIFKEILDEKCAILYDPLTPNSLTVALKKAVEMSVDEYAILRDNCNQLKLKYSEDAIGECYIKAFSNIIKDK